MNYTNHHVAKIAASDEEELLQAQAHMWNHLFSFINSMSLKCAIQLGIPDIIHSHGKPMTLSQLTDALEVDGAKAPCMHRLLRMLIHSGFFATTKIVGNDEKEEEEEEEEAYVLSSSASKLLLKDSPWSLRPLLLSQLCPIMIAPWQRLADWFRSNDLHNSMVAAQGKTFWEILGQEQSLNHFFNEAMASDSRLVSSIIIGNNNNSKRVFEGLSSLVDVGGGTGDMAKAIAEAFPEIKCTVLDLPRIVQGLEGTNNLFYVGGDMFQSIPPCDAVLLKWILHGWSDEECVKILKKCKESIPSKEKGGKVMIIEMVLGDKSNSGDEAEATQTQLFFDMQMMVMVNGKERHEKDWAKIFFEAGFSSYIITPLLGCRSLIEVYYHE